MIPDTDKLNSYNVPVCNKCKHYLDRDFCKAFPKGIPDDIFNAQLADAVGMDVSEIEASINAQKEQEAKNEDALKAQEKAEKAGEDIVNNKICVTKDKS